MAPPNQQKGAGREKTLNGGGALGRNGAENSEISSAGEWRNRGGT